MDVEKSLMVSFDTSASKDETKEEGSAEKEIELDYSDDDEEMLSDSENHPKRMPKSDQSRREDNFAPVDDVDVFAVDDDHVDTTGGEIRRHTNVTVTFDAEKLGGPRNVKRYQNPRLKGTDDFANFLNSDEQRARRQDRARRFGLDSTDTAEGSSFVGRIIDELPADILDKMYKYYNIDPNSIRHKEKYRLNTIYLRGVDEMSTDSIFDYFGPYMPSFLEWIDDNACNLVWDDEKAAARGLLGMASPLRRICHSKSGSGDKSEEEGEQKGESLVSPLQRKQRGSSMENDDVDMKNDDTGDKILDDDELVDVDVSQVTVPPGKWRVARKEEQDRKRIILMRFATVDDVKTHGAHRNSRYYREHGNPNFGGQIGLISRSYMDRVTRKRRQDSNETISFRDDLRQTINDRERWNLLREDSRRNPELEPGELVEEQDLATGEVKLTYFSSDDEEDEKVKSKRPRMRMRADEEEDRKERNWKRLQRVKHRGGAGIEGDWRNSQRPVDGGDLRELLRDSKMKVTVKNDQRDLRHRLGEKKDRAREDSEDSNPE